MDIKAQENDIIENADRIITGIETRQMGLPTYDGKGPSSKTKSEYRAIAKKLYEGATSVEQIISKAKNTRSKRTWFKRRAALIFVLIEIIRNYIRLIESESDQRNYAKWLEGIRVNSEVLAAIETTPSIANPVRAKSKKQDLKGLPKDWRQQIIARMPKYHTAILTLSLTGCRPSELAKGVEWSLADGELKAVIQGSKVGKHSGQETRELIFKIEGDFANMLDEEIRKAGGKIIVKIDSPGNLTTAIRSAGKRTFPKFKHTITSYSFRHQFAGDGKARADLTNDPESELLKLSASLGHATDLTKRYYGHKKQARGGGVGPEKVTQSRDVKRVKKKTFGPLDRKIIKQTLKT